MNIEECTKDKLWTILVETVHQLVMYPQHKAYSRNSVLPEKKDVGAEELAARLGISLGEALVILFELQAESAKEP
jgi:transcription initiation factor IIE alpha subunit